MAISPATGAWGIAEGDIRAMAGCAAKGATDCVVVIVD